MPGVLSKFMHAIENHTSDEEIDNMDVSADVSGAVLQPELAPVLQESAPQEIVPQELVQQELVPQELAPQEFGVCEPAPQEPAPQEPAPQEPAIQEPSLQEPELQEPEPQADCSAACSPQAPAYSCFAEAWLLKDDEEEPVYTTPPELINVEGRGYLLECFICARRTKIVLSHCCTLVYCGRCINDVRLQTRQCCHCKKENRVYTDVSPEFIIYHLLIHNFHFNFFPYIAMRFLL